MQMPVIITQLVSRDPSGPTKDEVAVVLRPDTPSIIKGWGSITLLKTDVAGWKVGDRLTLTLEKTA